MTLLWSAIALGFLFSWSAIPHLLLLDKRPVATLAWGLGLLLLPFPTLPLYLLIGTDRLQRQRVARVEPRQSREGLSPNPDPGEEPWKKALASLAGTPWQRLSGISWFTRGQDFYEHLTTSIREARESIYIETYIWQNDPRGVAMRDELVAAARRGIKVYLLVDELGSWAIRESFFSPLREAGGQFSWFYTVHPRRNRYFINLRNHRKIIVIDHRSGYLGGMNFGIEYEGKDPATGPWIDCHACVRGSIVHSLEEVFQHDWFFSTQTELPPPPEVNHPSGGSPAILIESGPDAYHERNHLAINTLIATARERIDLFTPYFIPTQELLHQLKLAALRGVRVRLLICQKSDIRFLIDISRSFYREMLDYQVGVYEFPDKVHHSKAIRVDDRITMIGSTNLDIRSLHLNFEANLYLEDAPLAKDLDEHFATLFAGAEKISLEKLLEATAYERMRRGFLRLLAPLL